MPELIEVERYRSALDPLVGCRISAVELPDSSYARGGLGEHELAAELVGASLVGTGRRGKLAWLQLDSGRRLGLRFGMTGRLVVGDVDPVGPLEYSSTRDDPSWDRFAISLVRPRAGDAAAGAEAEPSVVRVRLNDPRRLGSVELDPDIERLGPDAASLELSALRAALAGSRPTKAVLLDQTAVAGLGNLLVDEVLWRAGIDPTRPASSIDGPTVVALHEAMREVVLELTERGGSHRGDLQASRWAGATCPLDATPLVRRRVGGRTTFSCPLHQR